jgi:hypothetical protein
MKEKAIFWLHIKKSAGQSTRSMLSPYYKQVDRSQKPACFIQSDRQDWNDILNNYRVPLGEFQFKRCLFARTHLWKEEYDSLFKFAFVRNPIDRCLSQFFYLWRIKSGKRRTSGPYRTRFLAKMLRPSEDPSPLNDEFDRFLDAIESCRNSDSNHAPFDLHFQTHTADMWSDIADFEDNVLLDKVWRLEDIVEGINHVRGLFGDGPLEKHAIERKNPSTRAPLVLTPKQRLQVEKLFAKDFELYESS